MPGLYFSKRANYLHKELVFQLRRWKTAQKVASKLTHNKTAPVYDNNGLMTPEWSSLWLSIYEISVNAHKLCLTIEKELATELEVYNPGFKYAKDAHYDAHKAYMKSLDNRRPVKYKLHQKKLDAGKSWPKPPRERHEDW